MILAGFAGIGKTTFCERMEHAIDFGCMPYKYGNFQEIIEESGNGEEIKARPDLVLNPKWPDNYCDALIERNKNQPEEYIVVPSDYFVLWQLAQREIPYLLCYSVENAKEEYQRRFLERGNRKDFLEVFIGSWDYWMALLRHDTHGIPVELEELEFLTDVKDKIDGIVQAYGNIGT